jgi:hypothetical protein
MKNKETSATDSEKSEPCLVTALVEYVEGLQRHLQVLSKEIKKITRSKRWAQKAYRRRERRRAAKQKEVGYQPQFPADRLQHPATVGGNGNKAEEGTQSPQDWEPSKKDEARTELRSVYYEGTEVYEGGEDVKEESNREDLPVLGRTAVITGPRCSPHGPFGVGLRQAHDASRVRRTAQCETGNARRTGDKRKIQNS